MNLYLRGKTWWVHWSEGGKQHRISTKKKTRREAEVFAHNLESRKLDTKKDAEFSELIEEYLSWHKKEYPAAHERVSGIIDKHLKVFKDYPDPLSVERYKHSRKAAVATINKELTTLKAIMNYGVRVGLIQRNPITNVKPLKDLRSEPHNFFTREELDILYSEPYGDIYRLLANTGMRRSEAFNLRWDDVSDKILIRSLAQSRTKSAEYRVLPISDGCCEALQRLHITQHSAAHVLPRINKDSLSRAFRQSLQRHKLRGCLHDLRHTFISHLVMNGVPLRTVQVLAGHATYKTTEGYAHLSPDHLSSSVQRLNL